MCTFVTYQHMSRNIQRRDVVKGLGVAGFAGLAGCTTEESPDDDNGGDDEVPDAVMIVGFPQSGIQLFRDYYSEFADDTPELDIIVPDGLMDSDLPGEVDNDMNNVIGTRPSASGPGAAFFEDEYEAAYDREPGVFIAQAYDAMAINVLAAVAAGENTGSEIRDRVRTVANPGGEEFGPADLVEAVETVAAGDEVHYVGASSTADFDVNGDIVSAAYDVVDFQDGSLEVLDTVEFGTDLTDEDMDAVAEPPVGVDDFEAMVGVLMPETGDLGPLGTQIRDGALLAADQINDADINVSVDTRVEDTQTDPQAGISGANSLVEAGYAAVVGPAASNVNLQVADQVLIPNGVVGISPSSTDPDITSLDDDGYIFRTAPSDVLQGPALADLALGEFVGAQSSGTLYLNDAYGQALEGEYATSFEEAGGQLGQRVSFEPEQASYSSQWSDALNL